MSQKYQYFAIYKPFKVLSQFSNEGENPGLGSIYDLSKDVYPVGRLDLDSEGLLILTNDKSLNNKLLNPKNAHRRTYWAEVDGVPDNAALEQFKKGLKLNIKGKTYQTLPADIRILADVKVEERDPPVNYTKHPVRCWLEISLIEGKNRQVRKMTAAIGHPTLRLIRVQIESLKLFPLRPGEITQISPKAIYKKLNV